MYARSSLMLSSPETMFDRMRVRFYTDPETR